MAENTATPVGPLTTALLVKEGYAPKEIAAMSGETRLLQDLNLCGDDFWDLTCSMESTFGVDLSTAMGNNYYPSEHSNDAYIITFKHHFLSGILASVLGLFGLYKRLPSFEERRLKRLREAYDRYPEITLDMIETMLKEKRWIDPDDNQIKIRK